MKLRAELTRSGAGFEVILIDGILMADIDLYKQTKDQEEILGDIIGIAEQHKLSFRVYRTYGGLRPICISDFFKIAAGVSSRVMRDLNCDMDYLAVSRRISTFGCRISPKPFRVGMNMTQDFDFYNMLPYEKKEWLEEYNEKSKGYKTCEFLLQTSDCEIPQSIQNFIKVHEEKTKCGMDLPFA